MVVLLKKHGLIAGAVGRFITLRVNRGPLLRKPRGGSPSIVPDGRNDWLGWVELTTEAVSATATENTALVIDLLRADILTVVEAENRPGLVHFTDRVIAMVGGRHHDQFLLIAGNTERGISVGIPVSG